MGNRTIEVRNDGKYSFREVTEADIPELGRLFRSTVLSVNRKDYTAEEVADWASCGDSPEHWKELLGRLYFIAAEDTDGKMAGFASVSDDGYLHSMFVSKYRQREGVASGLLGIMERYADRKGVSEITSDVSITARPFFERHGYTVEAKQKSRARNMVMTNYRMRKHLFPDITIGLVTRNKRRFMPLLLQADEQESMIDRYLDRGDLFTMYGKDGSLIAVAVVTGEGEGIYELKNLAVSPDYRMKGYGKRMVGHISEHYRAVCRIMYVGTGDSMQTIPFYESCGFSYSHTVPDFFTENYDHEIIENGKVLKDMICLKK